jgi:serine/threonine-protein kinase
LPIDEAVAYAIEIGRGLTAAHARKLVHRDVKPQNVLIDPDGRAKVTDFGIARSLEQKGMTVTGRVLGTTDYVSPEQAMGEDVDERSDVYSLGIVLYEMLTGDVPFSAETQVGVAMRHVNEPMPDVQARRPEVSAAVASVIDRSTTKDPRDRYTTVAEMVRDLEQTLEVEAARRGGTSGEATSVLDSVPDKRRRLGRRRRISGPGVALAIVLIALAAAAVVLVSRLDLGGNEKGPSGTTTSEVKLSDDATSEFDPEGDQRETGTERQAIDSNPTGTAWSTEHYDTPDFGGLKDGVGLAIDGGDPIAAKQMVIRALTTGYDADIYEATGSPPSALSDWGQPVGSVSNGKESETVTLPGKTAQSFLIWITKLPTAEDDPGRYQMEISDVQLFK